MEKSLIQKRIRELSSKDYLDANANNILFEQYNKDKREGVPLEDSEARTLLIIGNEGLIYLSMMRKFGIMNPQQDMEQYGAGMIGLIKAVDKFDSSKGVAFSTYAMFVISNQIGMEYRKINKRFFTETNCIRLDDLSFADDEHSLTYDQMFGEEDTFIEDVIRDDFMANVERNLKYLNQIERDCLMYNFGVLGKEPISQAEISKILGVRQSTVSKAIKSAIHKLRVMTTCKDFLSDEDLIFRSKLIKAGGPLKEKTGLINS